MAIRLLTSDEVADLLKVTRNTLERWRREGEGPPAMKIGRQVRYDENELQTWLKRHALNLRP